MCMVVVVQVVQKTRLLALTLVVQVQVVLLLLRSFINESFNFS